REIVGDHRAGGDVDDRRDGDTFGVVGEPLEVSLLQPGDLEHWVNTIGIEIESPTALVMGWAAKPNGENIFQAQQPTDDDRAVGPWTSAANDEPIPAGLNRIAVASVGGDAGGDVVRVAVEFTLRSDIRGHGNNPASRGTATKVSPRLTTT